MVMLKFRWCDRRGMIYTVSKEDYEQKGYLTVEKVLKKRMGLSDREISRIKFAENGILLKTGKAESFSRVRISENLSAGDTLKIRMPERKLRPNRVPPTHGMIDILYEDGDYIALNKPAGMVTHPGNGHHYDTLANLLAGYCEEKEYDCSCKVIGRLDRETSGIVLFGKHRLAVSRIQKQQKEGLCEKKYLAIASWNAEEIPGLEKEYEIRSFMGAVKEDLMKQEIKPDGKGREAVTIYRIRKRLAGAALLEVRIKTGRTHQIRLHMASEGHPLLGDSLYGTERTATMMERTMLHAWKLHFCQPFTGKQIDITAPIPNDMKELIERIE